MTDYKTTSATHRHQNIYGQRHKKKHGQRERESRQIFRVYGVVRHLATTLLQVCCRVQAR